MAFFSSFVNQLESKAREVLQEGEKFLSDQPEDVPLNNFLSPPGEVKPLVAAEEEEEEVTRISPEVEAPDESFSHNVSTLTDSTEAAPAETPPPVMTREQQLFQEATKFQQEAQKYKSIIKKLKDKMDRDRQDTAAQRAELEAEISRLELETLQVRQAASTQVQECEERFGQQLQLIQQESNEERIRVNAGNEMEINALKQRLLELENTKPTIDMEAQLLQELEVERNRVSAAELKQQKLAEEYALQLETLQLQLIAQPVAVAKNENEDLLQELQRQVSQLHLEREAERMQFELALREQQTLPSAESEQQIAAMEAREKDLQVKLEDFESKFALQETQSVSREQQLQTKLEERESKLTLQEARESELQVKLEEYESKLALQATQMESREQELQVKLEECESKLALQETQWKTHEEIRTKLEECQVKLFLQETQLETREKELQECESKLALQEAELEANRTSFQAHLETVRNETLTTLASESTAALELEITELRAALEDAKLAAQKLVAEKEQDNATAMLQLETEIASKEKEIFELKTAAAAACASVDVKPIDKVDGIVWQETINALAVDEEALCLEQQLQRVVESQAREVEVNSLKDELTQSVNDARNEREAAQNELARLEQELATRAQLIDELQSASVQQEGSLKQELDQLKSQLEGAYAAHADAQQLAVQLRCEFDENRANLETELLLAGKQELQCELEQCKQAQLALQHELETVLSSATNNNNGDDEALEIQITALQTQINTDATMWALQKEELIAVRCEFEKQTEKCATSLTRENALMEDVQHLEALLQQRVEENSRALMEAMAKCDAAQSEIAALRTSDAEHVARGIELNNAMHTLRSELQANEASKELISKLEFELDALRTQFAGTEHEFAQATRKLEDSLVERNALEETVEQMESNVKQCEMDLALERQRVEALEMQSTQTQESAVLALENEFAEYRVKADAAFANAMQETAEAEARVETVKAQLAEELHAKYAAELDSVKQIAERELHLVKQEMQVIQTAAQSRVKELQQELEASKAMVAKENSTVQDRITELESELKQCQQERERASVEFAEQASKTQQQLEHAREAFNAELAQKSTLLDALQLELVGAANQQQAEAERFEALLQTLRDQLQRASSIETAAAPRRQEIKHVRTARASSMDILETGGLLPTTTTARPTATVPVVSPFHIDSSPPTSLRSIPAQLQGAVMDVVARGDFTGISRMKFTFGVLLYSVIVHLAMLGLYWRSCKEDMG